MTCAYDWAPGFAGQRLCCVADHHHADSCTTTVIVWPLSTTLEDMCKAGVLVGRALKDAHGGVAAVRESEDTGLTEPTPRKSPARRATPMPFERSESNSGLEGIR